MRKLSRWLASLTLLTSTAIAAAPPLTQPVSAVPTATSNKQENSIPIYVPPPERQSSGICPAFLEPAISSVIDSPSFAKGNWGVLVESLDGTTLYSRNADRHLIPASNIKLLTTAAALQRLDPQTSIRSTSLREWINVTNLRSNNNYANVLLRYIGGPQAVKTALSQLGVSPNAFRQVDGSGLSRSNSATPSALVDTLKAMSAARGTEIWYSSLPVAGTSGTLRNRLRNTSAQGKVRAKTGTLRGVRALSGYIDHPDYGVLAFSILVNQPNQSGQALVGAIDTIVLRLTQLTPC